MPIHLLPPWCRAFCSASRWRSVSISLSQPPSASIALFSSSVRSRSASFFSQSSGSSALRIGQGSRSLEALAEHAVEAVEMLLVLDQRRRARENRNPRRSKRARRASQRLQQRQVLRSETGTPASRSVKKKRANMRAGRRSAPAAGGAGRRGCSNRCTSCSFFSSAPCNGGMSFARIVACAGPPAECPRPAAA